jgi:hypothetical protein
MRAAGRLLVVVVEFASDVGHFQVRLVGLVVPVPVWFKLGSESRSPTAATGTVMTVFQNKVPNSKLEGGAVVHSDELLVPGLGVRAAARVADQLPPESQTNYRPSRRLGPITARAPARGPTLWSAGVAGYNPGPGRLKFELPSAPRGQWLLSGTPDSDSELKKNEPHAGGPIDRPKRQPRKGRPVISMPVGGSRLGDGSLVNAGRHARMSRPGSATGTVTCKHVATRVLRLTRPTPACVCSDSLELSLSGTRVLHQRGTYPGISEVQQGSRPVSHTLIKSARRQQPQLNYLQYMRRSRTSAQSVCSPAGSESSGGFVAAPSTECGQPRHAWSDDGTNMKEPRKSPVDCQSAAVPGQRRLHMRHGDRAESAD